MKTKPTERYEVITKNGFAFCISETAYSQIRKAANNLVMAGLAGLALDTDSGIIVLEQVVCVIPVGSRSFQPQ